VLLPRFLPIAIDGVAGDVSEAVDDTDDVLLQRGRGRSIGVGGNCAFFSLCSILFCLGSRHIHLNAIIIHDLYQ
jgi:hypothetical protein